MKKFITNFKIYRKLSGGTWYFVSKTNQKQSEFGYYVNVSEYFWTKQKPTNIQDILLTENN